MRLILGLLLLCLLEEAQVPLQESGMDGVLASEVTFLPAFLPSLLCLRSLIIPRPTTPFNMLPRLLSFAKKSKTPVISCIPLNPKPSHPNLNTLNPLHPKPPKTPTSKSLRRNSPPRALRGAVLKAGREAPATGSKDVGFRVVGFRV